MITKIFSSRYLIVMDDMQTDQWNTIASSFPDDEQFGSRVLVTTTVLSVANACSSTNGYVFKMRKLDEKQSKELFLKKACPEYYLEYAALHSRQILEKCDGQALALVTVGQYLRKTGWPTEHSFDNPCHQLRCELLEDKTLERIRRVLVRTYASLPGHAPRACLMYFGMFPCDRPVRRKKLMRLWLAEGFLGKQPLYDAMELAAKNFDKLIDHNIIEPIDVSNNSKVKTCKTYGMMHEFILIKSISQDIIALFGDEKLKFKPCHVRRLCLHSSNASSETNLDVHLSLVRSLTVYGEARTTILDFHQYKLLRVLNLEECTTDLGNKNLRDICKLRLLKYLSLGVTVKQLPRQIGKLRLLETLDLRRTKVNILAIEVLLLPCLIHLFGKFQLSHKVRKIGDVPNFLLSKGSQLETLAGFINDKRQVFAQIMRYMKKLSKVKIWCDGTTTGDEFVHLSAAIQAFIQDKKDGSNDARSLSVHINEFTDGLLDSLKDPCYLTSLKLQGKLVKLPRFVQLLRGLTELCIQSTELNTHLLGELGGLKSLRYLKLIADQLEEFAISDQSFPMLLRFCLVLECSTLPIIKQGALKYLTSLKVMCKGLIGLCGIKIEYLNCLKEITLHAEVNPRAKEEWEEAARNHPNRPNILLLKKDNNIVNESSDDSVATNVRLENFAVFDQPAEENDTQMLLNH